MEFEDPVATATVQTPVCSSIMVLFKSAQNCTCSQLMKNQLTLCKLNCLLIPGKCTVENAETSGSYGKRGVYIIQAMNEYSQQYSAATDFQCIFRTSEESSYGYWTVHQLTS